MFFTTIHSISIHYLVYFKDRLMVDKLLFLLVSRSYYSKTILLKEF